MVRTPHYYKNLLNRVDAQVLYFRAVADQVKIPIMIYNWPQATGVDITAEAVAVLSQHPNIFAMKESSGSLEKCIQMMKDVKPGFQVLTGSAPILAPSLAVGCAGAVLAFANAVPVHRRQYLGSAPLARIRRRDGLAASHHSRRAARHDEVRHSRAEARDGYQRILRRSAAAAADGDRSRGEEGNRAGVRRTERLMA